MKRILFVVFTVCALAALLAMSASAVQTAVSMQNISNAIVTVSDAEFIGAPVEPDVDVRWYGLKLYPGSDYTVIYENNVNIGTGLVRIVGRGNYYGYVEQTFQIIYGDSTVTLPGAYNGSANGELNEQVYYAEGYLSPGKFQAYTDCSQLHTAYYMLYRMDGDTPTLILEEEKGEGIHNNTMFTYDFSSSYNKSKGETYILGYSWITRNYDVYSGVIAMYIPGKIAPASALKVEKLPDLGNYYTQYLSYYGADGVVDMPQWTTSDSTVATVNNGVVTFQKAGTVTITAKNGKLSDSITLTGEAQQLSNAVMVDYDEKAAKAILHYKGYLLTEGKDYTLSVTINGTKTQVTATGINMFTGQLTKMVDTCASGHKYSEVCDSVCDRCGYTRNVTHTFSTKWTKDKLCHWYACTSCGVPAEKIPHTISAEDPQMCTVCGTLNPIGDLDGSAMLDVDDAIYLLQHVLMPDMFPVNVPVDYDGSGQADVDDAIYLLQHILMPDMFPLIS